MILNVLGAACMLLWVNITPVQSTTSCVSVEPISIEAPAQVRSKMTSETETILIDDHATPHWGFTGTEAWDAYQVGTLKITELVAEKHYLITYDGGVLDVLLEGSM
ncbi:MAG TPA: hypothetical protein ENJ82_04690 [Bacteroidetes bacterium]|nr:hypothetical protein [Bacteroidota bacterium]